MPAGVEYAVLLPDCVVQELWVNRELPGWLRRFAERRRHTALSLPHMVRTVSIGAFCLALRDGPRGNVH